MNDKIPAKYTDICKASNVPFFFIPFKHSDKDQTYALGLSYVGITFKSWSYGLKNNIENEQTIRDVYTQIFQTISQNRIQNK